MRAGKELDTAVREMMVQCLQDRPEEPMSWMLGYMLNQNAGLATPETPCAVASTSEPADGPAMHLAVSHPDAATQKVCISVWDRSIARTSTLDPTSVHDIGFPPFGGLHPTCLTLSLT